MSGIFISYRRSASQHFARSIYNALRQHGHDVFFDINSIDNGPFDQAILNQIAARPHFLLVLSKGSLERCINTGDWLRLEIEEAFRLGRNIVPIYDEGFDINSENQFLPEPIRSKLPLINSPRYFHDYFDEFIQRINDRFLKQVIDPSTVTPTPPAERAAQLEVSYKVQTASPQAQAAKFAYELVPPTPSHPQMWGVENILPQPFEWVYIPEGNVSIQRSGAIFGGDQKYQVDSFNIAKYPITNAQFETFIQAEDGYSNHQWWEYTSDAQKWRKRHYAPPRRTFPQNDHPRANINWYEAMAFCNWLEYRFNTPISNPISTKITLQNSKQWYRAAYSDKQLKFPWGANFDAQYCNVKESKIGQTTPVTQYMNGSSPYGVMDMIGNISEWCLGDDMTKIPIRGGSWADHYVAGPYSGLLSELATARTNTIGFRIVMMNG